jgi:SpoIID/LytB domain protein
MIRDLMQRTKDAMPLWGFPAIIALVIVIALVVIIVAGSSGHKSTYSAEGLDRHYSFRRWEQNGEQATGIAAVSTSAPQDIAPAPVLGGSTASSAATDSSAALSNGTNVPGANATFVFKSYGRAHGVGLCMDGVNYRALAGQSYQEIINYYYTGVTMGQTDDTRNIRVKGNDGVIYNMPMKDYLNHLAEEPDDYPTEGLKVFYVAARTYTLSVIARGKHAAQGFDLCSSGNCCQAFDPNKAVSRYPNSIAAESATAGQIILYNGQPIIAAYCGSCGGHTENNEDAWGGQPLPYLRGKPDSYCSKSPRFSTTKEISVSELQGHFGVGELKLVELSDRDAGGRVKHARIVGSGGTKTVTGKALADILGFKTNRYDYTFK